MMGLTFEIHLLAFYFTCTTLQLNPLSLPHFLLSQIAGWVDKLSGEAGVDEVPESLEATQRVIEAAEGNREQVLQFLMTTTDTGQRLLQDLRYANIICEFKGK